MKSFKLFGGSDEDREALATLIRETYGHAWNAQREFNPAFHDVARSVGIEIILVSSIERLIPSVKNSWTDTIGSGTA